VRPRSALLGLGVGLALADSSIVTLALPRILGDFDVSITSVAWVLTSFNLVLALVAVPAAYVSRRRPREAFVVGVLVFALASLACGLAPSFDVLVGARCVQAVGAALLVTAALDLLSQVEASDEAALRVWVAAGILGAALGPAAGGILTQLLGWESIFLAQVPIALALLPASRPRMPRRILDRGGPGGRPSLPANLALLLVAGGLVAALFLVVLLLVDGWGMSPAAAGIVVTVMPLTAIAVGRVRPRSLGVVQGCACGVILIAGGLAALALMPRAGWWWTVPPQILVGAGLGLTIGGLTELAVRGRPDQVVHGGWTLSARHAGVVLGLLLLAPVLTSALDENRDEAIRAGAAIVLDSRIPPLAKLGVAQDVLAEVDRANDAGELPDVQQALASRTEADDEDWTSLVSGLQDQLDRAVTSAFFGPFLLAAALALAALVPLAFVRRRQA
jgi:MFS family permease